MNIARKLIKKKKNSATVAQEVFKKNSSATVAQEVLKKKKKKKSHCGSRSAPGHRGSP